MLWLRSFCAFRRGSQALKQTAKDKLFGDLFQRYLTVTDFRFPKVTLTINGILKKYTCVNRGLKFLATSPLAYCAKAGSPRGNWRSKERGYNVSEEIRHTSNKFVGRVENIFANLPKPLEWLSFLNHGFPLLMDFCEEVQEVSIQNHPWPRPGM